MKVSAGPGEAGCGCRAAGGCGFLLEVLASDQAACVIGLWQRGEEDLMMKATRVVLPASLWAGSSW